MVVVVVVVRTQLRQLEIPCEMRGWKARRDRDRGKERPRLSRLLLLASLLRRLGDYESLLVAEQHERDQKTYPCHQTCPSSPRT